MARLDYDALNATVRYLMFSVFSVRQGALGAEGEARGTVIDDTATFLKQREERGVVAVTPNHLAPIAPVILWILFIRVIRFILGRLFLFSCIFMVHARRRLSAFNRRRQCVLPSQRRISHPGEETSAAPPSLSVWEKFSVNALRSDRLTSR